VRAWFSVQVLDEKNKLDKTLDLKTDNWPSVSAESMAIGQSRRSLLEELSDTDFEGIRQFSQSAKPKILLSPFYRPSE
jgi:hypothetical protein